MPGAGQEAQVVLRPLQSREDFRQCLDLQRETWGGEFTALVPAEILMISQKVGGVAAGAFDPDDRLLGFVFGVSGVREGKPAHWSHMLAVRRDARGLGLGKRLKLYQRDRLLESGIEVVYWTYDPLVSRNANLNLNALGAKPVDYVVNMYGTDQGSQLDSGLDTDRFIVRWDLRAARVQDALKGRQTVDTMRFVDAPIVAGDDVDGSTEDEARELPADPSAVRVAVPSDIELVRKESPEVARLWRKETRQAFLGYLERGFCVDGFWHDQETRRGFYLLIRHGAR